MAWKSVEIDFEVDEVRIISISNGNIEYKCDPCCATELIFGTTHILGAAEFFRRFMPATSKSVSFIQEQQRFINEVKANWSFRQHSR